MSIVKSARVDFMISSSKRVIRPCTPVEMLRRVEALDELHGLRRPRGAVCVEGLAAQQLGVVDAQLGGEDLVAQPFLRAGVVVPCLLRIQSSVGQLGARLWNMMWRLFAPALSLCRGCWPGRGDSLLPCRLTTSCHVFRARSMCGLLFDDIDSEATVCFPGRDALSLYVHSLLNKT